MISKGIKSIQRGKKMFLNITFYFILRYSLMSLKTTNAQSRLSFPTDCRAGPVAAFRHHWGQLLQLHACQRVRPGRAGPALPVPLQPAAPHEGRGALERRGPPAHDLPSPGAHRQRLGRWAAGVAAADRYTWRSGTSISTEGVEDKEWQSLQVFLDRCKTDVYYCSCWETTVV